jgi:hypothetical protein
MLALAFMEWEQECHEILSHIWPFRRPPDRQMISFIVNGLVEQFRCSECRWASLLEETFFHF